MQPLSSIRRKRIFNKVYIIMQSSQKQKLNSVRSGGAYKKKGSNFSGNVSKTKTLKVGSVLNIKISSLVNSNVGMNEFTYSGTSGVMPIYIGGLEAVKASLGDLVQVQVLKVLKSTGKRLKSKAIAKVTKVVKKATKVKVASNLLQNSVNVTIVKIGPKGTYIAQSSDGGATAQSTRFIVYSGKALTTGQNVTVTVTKLTAKYAFAKLTKEQETLAPAVNSSKEGPKFNVVLPKKAKRYLKHIVFQVSSKNNSSLNSLIWGDAASNLAASKLPTILFVKPLTGSKLGDKVQIQVVKAYSGGALKKANIVIAKIVEVNPLPTTNKKLIITNTIKQMLNSDMHYGEKAIRCNARMKNYVMYTKASKKPLIKKGRNIINLLKTRRCLNKSLVQLTKYAAQGKTFLFVGTKKSASGLIARASLFSKKAFFVNTRWLGGMLTNWKTILKSISKIRPILKEKQIIIKDILTKRQNIKTLLMEKAFLLKKKSKLVIQKGKQLVQKLAKSKNSLSLVEKSQKLALKRKEFVQKGQVLLEKRQLLLQKRKQVISQSQVLNQKAVAIVTNSKELLTRANFLRKKINELKSLLQVSQQIQKIQQTAKKENNGPEALQLYALSYNQYKEVSATQKSFVIPNPPKTILNKMVLFIKSTPSVSNTSKKDTSPKSKVLMLTSLLNSIAQANSFAAAIKTAMKSFIAQLNEVQNKLVKFQTNFKTILTKLEGLVAIKTNIVKQLKSIRDNLNIQRNGIRVLKKKFKQIAAQKRLLKFLPKLRYLPTPLTKFYETVQILMKKVVDPKLKYPIDSLYDSKLRTQTKKVGAMRKKKWQRLEKYLGGISNIGPKAFNIVNTQQTGPTAASNTIAIIIGQQEEMNAVRECQKLGIKMFHLIDTNCNPGLADHFVPANDDSRKSIKFVLTQFLTRIRLAQKLKKVARNMK